MAEPVFKQPYVEKGMGVLWTVDGNYHFAALVIGINQTNLDLLVFYPEGNTLLRDGVRHRADPFWKDANGFQREQGMWEHNDFTKRLLSIVNDLAPKKEEKK